jgi:hypothetical protein
VRNPVGLGCLEEFRERAIQQIQSEDWRARVEALFTTFVHDEAKALLVRTNTFPSDELHYMREKGAIGVAVNAAALLHHFGELAADGYLVCEYDLWGSKDVDARYGERVFDIGFLRPTGRNQSVMFNIETKNYERVTAATLSRLSKQILYDSKRLNPRSGLQPIIPVWTFMQGVSPDARYALEAKGFRVLDFMTPRLFLEMKKAIAAPIVGRR